ncbi:MAG TPA: glutamine-hydrolyzing carbamoyl-phosphate synthase small subunit [Thermomicrobiales bacterium]|nr:glutamine-hydrolyzing carbamoyl-phosphate synthase small subunit [Thermomicrobiales bacterium]
MSVRKGDAAVILEDGRVFRGVSFGAERDAEGEVVFTTSMTGYQEVATDPSFRGQIVCMTYPIIGNYGVTADDDQSRQPWISGMIVRDYTDWPSNWRSQGTLADYFKRHDIPAISGVDTRALTRHIRRQGAMRGLLVASIDDRSLDDLKARPRTAWTPADANVVADVTTDEPRDVGHGDLHVVLIDCGVKENILESLERRGVRVTVVPFDTPYDDIAALHPDGVLTSPGPGDPEQAAPAAETIRALIDARVPYLGVCLGHQLLAHAIGATTSKLKYGHHGGNHPVLDIGSGRVHITSQNHGYQVDASSVPERDGWRVSQINLNDRSVEGLAHATLPVFSIQYHPEGAPGPQDTQYVFDQFVELLRAGKRQSEGVTA